MRAIPAILLLLAIGVTGAVSAAESASIFPTLPTRSLDGAAVRVPTDVADGPVLLIVGFTRASREQTKAWSQRVAAAGMPIAYSVAVIEDVPGLLRGMVTRGMRKGVPVEMQARFLLVTEDVTRWKALSGFVQDQEDAAYLLLLDSDRRIVWRHAGPLDESAWRELRAALGVR